MTASRIESVDALRGFALIGVGLVHMLEQFAAAPPPEDILQVAMAGTLDKVIFGLDQAFMVGKFYLIFSLLFGLSFFIQIDGPKQRGEPFHARFAWRLALLFAFGFVHHLFHRGDILMLYAVLGLMLLVLHRVSTRMLVTMAIILFLGLGRFVSFALFGDDLRLVPGDAPENLAYFQVLMNGSLWDVFSVNLSNGWKNLVTFQFGMIGRGYVTLGLFMLGIVLGRRGLFRDLAAHRRMLIRALRWAGAGLVVSFLGAGALFSQVAQPASLSTWPEAFALTFVDLANLSLATVYACTFLLAVQSVRWGHITRWLAPYGRMALTNYLLQGLVGSALMYGWGLGQLGQWSSRYLLLLGVVIALAQVVGSHLWMARFRYGPCEWLWRCGTLRRRIGIRRARSG